MDAGIPGCFGCVAPFPEFQMWLVQQLQSARGLIGGLTETKYGWPVCETLHFFGLSMLLGTIGMFDLRVLGLAKRIPMASLHRLVPWGVAGFVLNAMTGFVFLVTYPNLYVYQVPFQLKMLFIALAGINVLAFKLFVPRKLDALGSGDDAPLAAKIMCGASLFLWIGVLVAGRYLAFFKPLFTGF